MVKYKKAERQRLLQLYIERDPFLTDEALAKSLNVSIQTIRLDRQVLKIPELRARIKAVAKEVDEIKSIMLEDIVGDILNVKLNESGTSVFTVEETHVFNNKTITRGHFLFAQANSLCVAMINVPLALTKSANIEFKKPVHLGDRVVAHAKVVQTIGKIATIKVESFVEDSLVFVGDFEMYFKNEGEVE
ncbi:transcription factor FapR [Phocicoccus pinnipedialis]|uniref:Transcription factor FapR n=1 Tax=Phocicoccus pinnipedialis TaxID=110845 RepID=A0A6V7RHQ9_9BACL|nr:transcription factor FapR [Jeotgalicoccus pinnipedialis]MBP1939084.1 acyl-coenzyme A thioesterase PaaI-like protein [Jeotgalicoccus pinnipedialis]CAD2076873.1 Transcription factor FapR [Jeotgalicoccus pinnipedialis]